MSKVAEAVLSSRSEELFRLSEQLLEQFIIYIPSDDGTQIEARAGDVAEFVLRWAGSQDGMRPLLKAR